MTFQQPRSSKPFLIWTPPNQTNRLMIRQTAFQPQMLLWKPIYLQSKRTTTSKPSLICRLFIQTFRSMTNWSIFHHHITMRKCSLVLPQFIWQWKSIWPLKKIASNSLTGKLDTAGGSFVGEQRLVDISKMSTNVDSEQSYFG